MRDNVNEHSLIKNRHTDVLSFETECTASPMRDNDFLSVQLEAVRLKEQWMQQTTHLL